MTYYVNVYVPGHGRSYGCRGVGVLVVQEEHEGAGEGGGGREIILKSSLSSGTIESSPRIDKLGPPPLPRHSSTQQPNANTYVHQQVLVIMPQQNQRQKRHNTQQFFQRKALCLLRKQLQTSSPSIFHEGYQI